MHAPINKRIPVKDRFWAKVDKSDKCWNWTASTDRTGYGKFMFEGRLQPAHRLSFSWLKGEIPDGLVIDHMCFNRVCVNPDHLRLATTKQNNENRSGADSDSRSGIRGVYFQKGWWFAQVSEGGEVVFREKFRAKEEAAVAAAQARLRMFTHTQEPLVSA